MTNPRKIQSSRRRFVQLMGIGSGSLLLTSISGRLASTVYGQEDGQGVFVVTGFNNGMPHWITEEGSDLRWAMPNFALEDIRDRVSTVEDTYNPHDRQDHGSHQAFLCVQQGERRDGFPNDFYHPGGISIDRHMAGELSTAGVRKSVNLGYPYGFRTRKIANASADGPKQPYPVFSDPVKAVAEYFGESDPGGNSDNAAAEAVLRARQRKSVLDFLTADIQRMSTRLAASERAGMDQYLTSVRELELEAQAIIDRGGGPSVECSPLEWAGGAIADHEDENNARMIREDLMHFFYDLAGIALACGVSRVANLNGPGVGDDPGNPRYPFLTPDSGPMPGQLDTRAEGIHFETAHRLHEDFNRDYLRRVFEWRGSLVRRIWRHLEQADVGGKTLADDSLLLWLNSMGRHPERGNHHARLDYIPVIVVGTAGGRLQTGRVVRFGTGERCVGDVFLTAARAMGSTITSFGDPAHSKGPIEELLA